MVETNYRNIKCQNCGSQFVFSKEEEGLYRQRNLEDPKYCPICRGIMKAKGQDDARGKFERSNSKIK